MEVYTPKQIFIRFRALLDSSVHFLTANIKGEWTEYNYSIDIIHTSIGKVIDAFKEQNIDAEYLGKSKAIKDNKGEITLLKKKCLFFKLHK